MQIPDAKVVFTGDLFWRNIQPNLIDASTRDWIDTLDMLLKMETGTTFVPGHGEVGTTLDVATFREYLATMRKLVSEGQVAGKSGEALVDVVIPALADKYKSWDKTWEAFAYFAKRNILEIEAELNGNKKVPQPLRANGAGYKVRKTADHLMNRASPNRARVGFMPLHKWPR